MSKLQPEDLAKISQRMKRTMTLREGDARAKITVHMGTCGIAAGARPVMKALIEAVEEHDAKDIILATSSCAGLCSLEPMVTIEIQGAAPVKYVELTPEKAKRIFEEHALGGKVVTEFALAQGSERMA